MDNVALFVVRIMKQVISILDLDFMNTGILSMEDLVVVVVKTNRITLFLMFGLRHEMLLLLSFILFELGVMVGSEIVVVV